MLTNFYLFDGFVIFIDNINARFISIDFIILNLLWLAFLTFCFFLVKKDKLNKKLKEIDKNLKL